MEDLLKIFRINKPHGIKGEVKATLLINIKDVKQLVNKLMFLKLPLLYQPVTLIKITLANQSYILKFKEFNNINEVLGFKECYLLCQKADLELATIISQEDLTNFKVFYQNVVIGTLLHQFETKAHVVFEIKKTDETKMMIPYVDEYIEQIDLSQQKIILKKVI
ncbi:ribosome maturation factor RimM [Spiroplasma sp. SV19]|uniref:ribosome maturation factor RimM n=1 Tax=Spiroplasma sp. SV19 TaxID=2570468 RepID=UPI0024B79E18|nr:ribosome maturation factor RimM [Spiroplasma sp. SV19]WHQ36839.1 16S rRNA processing protein RimM [Spiroplasma sp. SV19]